MDTTIPKRRLERPYPHPDLPPDFDPDLHPIIAKHFFGLHPTGVTSLWWRFARLGHRLPPERGVTRAENARA